MESPNESATARGETTVHHQALEMQEVSKGKVSRVVHFAEGTTDIPPISYPTSPTEDLPESPREYTRPKYPSDVSYKPTDTEQPVQEEEPPRESMSSLVNGRHSATDVSIYSDAPDSEKQLLEEAEERVNTNQVKDVKAATMARIAKLSLRGVSFTCSLIILSMLAATLSIFNTTTSLPSVNNVPPWAQGTKPWAQVTLLIFACISLLMCIIAFIGHFRGGYRIKALAAYSTLLAALFFIFSTIMWAVGAALLVRSKAKGNGHDIWGWSCSNESQRSVFSSDIAYDLICHYQSWAFVCCIIEVVVEVLTLLVYSVFAYRYYSMRRLTKSMTVRDSARSDLYSSQQQNETTANASHGNHTDRSIQLDAIELATDVSRLSAKQVTPTDPKPSRLRSRLGVVSKWVVSRRKKAAMPVTSHTGEENSVSTDKRYSAVAIPGSYQGS